VTNRGTIATYVHLAFSVETLPARNFTVELQFFRVLTTSYRQRGLQLITEITPILTEGKVMTSPVCALRERPNVILRGAVTFICLLRDVFSDVV